MDFNSIILNFLMNLSFQFVYRFNKFYINFNIYIT